MITVSVNELFSLRHGERVELYEFDQPAAERRIAVQARSIAPPPGAFNPTRAIDGAPTVKAAIVAAQWIPEEAYWQWLNLSPATKEQLGDLIFDNGGNLDQWYYAVISPGQPDEVPTAVTLPWGFYGRSPAPQ